MSSLDKWSFELAEDIDIPGWVFLPEGLTLPDQQMWLTEVTKALCDLIRSEQLDDSTGLEGEVRSVLEAGLAERARSKSSVMYQVWPAAAAAATMCHVNIAASADLPDWNEMDGRVHTAEARYMGPGLQYSTRRQVETDDGPLDVNSVHFIFDDGSVAVMLHLEESLPALISQSLIPFTIFKDALRMVGDDGTEFTAVEPTGVIVDDTWPVKR